MSKKNKRVAALITAVLVLALTVAGSLTVSAIPPPISGDEVYMEITEIGKETIDGTEYVKVSYSTPSGETWTKLTLTVTLGSSTVYTGESTLYAAQGSFCVPVTSFASADYYIFTVVPTSSNSEFFGDSATKYIKYENGTLTVGYYAQTTTPDDFKNLTYVSQSSLKLSYAYSYASCTYNGKNYLIGFPCKSSDKYCYVYKIGDDGSLLLHATKNIFGGSYYGLVNRIYCDSTNIYFAGWRVGTSSINRSDVSAWQTTYYSLADFFSKSNLYSNSSVSYGPTRIGSYPSCHYTYQSTVYNGYFYEFYQSSSGQPITLKVLNIADNTTVTHSSFMTTQMSDFYNFQQVGSYCYWTCGTNGTTSGVYIAALNLSTLEVTYTRVDDIVSSYQTSMIAESNDSFIFLSSTPVRVNIVTNTYYTATLSSDGYNVSAIRSSNNSIRFGSYIIAGSYKIQYTNYLPSRLYTEAEYQAALSAGACDKTHVTDTNNDGYDDSSYTAGYNSGAATASTASPLLSYSQGQLSWRKIKDSNSVYIEYMTYQDYLIDSGWTPLPNSTDYTDGFWEIDSYDWNYEKTHNSKWVQFRLVETTDSGDKYSNTIQIDVCLDTHVVDKNNDGYDDSAYSAGYNAGSGSGACSLIHVVDNDNDTYDDVSFTAGKQAGINYQKNKSSDSGVADFVTKILGAFTGSALYVGSNISVGGVTLLTIIGIIAIGGAVIIILKVSKGG